MTEFHATRNTEKEGTRHAGEREREREREREKEREKGSGVLLGSFGTYSSK